MPPPGEPTRVAPGPPEVTQGQAIGAADVFVPDEVVVLAAAGAPASVGGDVARDFNLEPLEQISVALTGDRMLRFRIPDGREVEAVVAALAADARLEGPQPNFVYRPQQGGGLQQAPPDLQYALAKVDIADAHTLANGAGVLIAVIDWASMRAIPILRARSRPSWTCRARRNRRLHRPIRTARR